MTYFVPFFTTALLCRLLLLYLLYWLQKPKTLLSDLQRYIDTIFKWSLTMLFFGHCNLKERLLINEK